MDSGSGITAMSKELAEALRRQPGMMRTALTQAFVGRARVVTSLGQECDIVTQSCPLRLTIETPWGPIRFCDAVHRCLLYTSPSPRDLSTSRMPSSA